MCQLCERKPKYVEQDNKIFYFDRIMNSTIIAEGNYHGELYMGVRPHSAVSLWFEREDGEIVEYFPTFCPECGRRLINEETE